MMMKSRILPQEKVYVKFDDDGNTSFVKSGSFDSGYSYRRVHYTKEDIVKSDGLFKSEQVFLDKQFPLDESEVANLDPNGGQRIVLRRLYDLYRQCPRDIKPQFFPPDGYIPPRKLSSNPYLPPFATEIGVFPATYYKSFFLVQDFAKNGMYQMVINNKGRFQTDVVDDWVPVYQYSLEPIWGLQLDQAWQIILLKFWAKKNGGYNNIKTIPPFRFLECFSNSNWKFYNLAKQGYGFLNFYTGRSDLGKFILKTKNSGTVLQSGLIPNSAGYQMVNLVETTPANAPTVMMPGNLKVVDPKARTWVATIRSTLVNKWAGGMSVLDKQINNRYSPQKNTLALDRDFMINSADLVNLFSTAYIASKRDQKQQHYFSDYYVLQAEPNIKKSIYLKFFIPNDGWLDFCVKQFDQNRVQPISAASRVKTEQYNRNQGIDDGLRYLRCRYILVKKNDPSSPSTFNDPNYEPPMYDTYDIQYLRGYNRGDARFLKIIKGEYILKIKPQSINKTSFFVVNYASNSQFDMNQYFPSKEESSRIMRQSMASLIGLVTSYHLDVNKRYEQITFANVFEDIGYGFVGVRSKKICPYRILMDIDPVQVNKSGYKIKNIFKSQRSPFSIIVNPGECTSIVLKKIPNFTNYIWPPNGFEIFQQRT